jgi:hypothetical protein
MRRSSSAAEANGDVGDDAQLAHGPQARRNDESQGLSEAQRFANDLC